MIKKRKKISELSINPTPITSSHPKPISGPFPLPRVARSWATTENRDSQWYQYTGGNRTGNILIGTFPLSRTLSGMTPYISISLEDIE